MVRSCLVFLILILLKVISRIFYPLKVEWVGKVPPDPWRGHRVVAILNHTSLFDWIWVGAPPPSFLWQLASHGVVPVADITLNRPLAGMFFRLVARHVVSISRERDHTWSEVMAKINDEQSLVVMAPEGRMMRRDGLDKNGKPMTVRGGIADIIEAVPDGRLLLAYSTGLHHVQAPGEGLPRVFKKIHLRLEALDLAHYREELKGRPDFKSFKRAVVADLEARRDQYCWPDPSKRPPGAAAARETAEASAAPPPQSST